MSPWDDPAPFIPGYRLVRAIHRGAASTVFEAERDVHGRVALKLQNEPGRCGDRVPPRLRPFLGYGEQEEFRLDPVSWNWCTQIRDRAAGLYHPGIVCCCEYGRWTNRLFVTTPFVTGEDLGRRLGRDGRVPDPEAVRVTRQAAAALDHAHAFAVVHGNLHPRHVLLDALDLDNQVRLVGFVDFPTDPTAAVGNPLHFAPEQFLTPATPLTPAADVYGLAETAWWMLTGEHPFGRLSLSDLIAAKQKGPPDDFARVRPDLPAAVGRALRRGMATQPAGRFRSAGEFAEELAVAVEGRAKRWWQVWK